MESREQFYNTISRKYSDLSQGKVSTELIDAVSKRIADFFYDQYQQFRKQYPKSSKRYSSFHIKDLYHPYTMEFIIKILKEKVGDNYEEPATKLLGMTVDELKEFERNREEFYKMF